MAADPVLVLQLHRMGDLILTFPLLMRLRQLWPDNPLWVVAEPVFFQQLMPLAPGVVFFPPSHCGTLAQQSYAAAINLSSSPLAAQTMLSSLKGGGTRLDLQLNPQELGSINVSLTVRNGEVSAIIRSEKSETTDMINRQVDAIRSNLEQQGIKVDKVEVRQDTRQDQNSASWQDFTQHNARQEEDARREGLARLKNLAGVRNSTSNSAMTTLEQPVHSLGSTAIYATSNLNVVA